MPARVQSKVPDDPHTDVPEAVNTSVWEDGPAIVALTRDPAGKDSSRQETSPPVGKTTSVAAASQPV